MQPRLVTLGPGVPFGNQRMERAGMRINDAGAELPPELMINGKNIDKITARLISSSK